ncbi:MAG: 4'-phosphopantetheinyl transferase superfamily protein [Candidatus Dormibacteraeota bacterium]|nr:4'-phosphopantetheinyl transferase superfamily protein [Candidatus Dormibacteraeota bacterium]
MTPIENANGSHAALPAGELHFWSVELDGVPRAQVEVAAGVLSADERARAERIQSPQRRRRWIACRCVLREVLARYCRTPPQRINFRYGPYGKPEIAADESACPIYFSVSHSQGQAVYAVAGKPVGVDLERHRPLPVDELAGRFLSAYEAAAVEQQTGAARQALFLRCWTRKEAYLKAIGVGLSGSLTDFDVDLRPTAERALIAHRGDAREPDRWTLFAPVSEPGFEAAVVVSGRPWALRRFDWEAAQ